MALGENPFSGMTVNSGFSSYLPQMLDLLCYKEPNLLPWKHIIQTRLNPTGLGQGQGWSWGPGRSWRPPALLGPRIAQTYNNLNVPLWLFPSLRRSPSHTKKISWKQHPLKGKRQPSLKLHFLNHHCDPFLGTSPPLTLLDKDVSRSVIMSSGSDLECQSISWGHTEDLQGRTLKA